MGAITKTPTPEAGDKPAVIEGKNGGKLTPIRTREKAQEMARRRWASWDVGVTAGMAQAAAEHADMPNITPSVAGQVYAAEIGRGILANAMDKPLDAARAVRAMRPADTQDSRSQPTIAIQVNVSPAVAAAAQAWVQARK